MTLKIEMLRCFATVARVGNLSEAAARLGRTPAALSMTLKQMEEHLGQRLFERDRKNRLTPLGQQIFELALQQINQFDETVQAIDVMARAPQGVLRVVSVPSVAALVFPRVAGQMIRRYPQLSLDLRDADSAQGLDALVRGQADLAVVSGVHRLSGVRSRELFSDRFGLVCAATHPLARQQRVTVGQLAGAGLVQNDLSRQIDVAPLRDVLEGARVQVRNILSLIAMIRTADCVAVLPETVVNLAPDMLVFRPIDGVETRRVVSLLQRQKLLLPEQTQELAELIARSQH